MSKRFLATVRFHLIATIWFAVTGAIFAGLLSLFAISWPDIPASEIVRLIFVISFFSGMGGLMLGASIPNKELVRTHLNAVARGIGIAVFAFPLSCYTMMELPPPPARVPSLSAQLHFFPLMLICIALLIGWLVVIFGAAAGWLLFLATNELSRQPKQHRTGTGETGRTGAIEKT